MVPNSIMHGFIGYQQARLKPLGAGLVNSTFLLHTANNKSVLQRLNPVFTIDLVRDTTTITKHLAAHGWEVAKQLHAQNGRLYLQDTNGFLWRRLSYIESDGIVPESLTPQTLTEIGDLLGRWHRTLAMFKHEPRFTILHFHDADYHADRLTQTLPALPSAETQEFARHILSAYEKLSPLPKGKVQLIHGDPQLTNMLFRDGKPFTYIDLDTTMRGSVWLDIGDLLRAVLEDDLKAGRPLSLEKIHPIVEGYRTAASPKSNSNDFYNTALVAIQQIALELAMRFMNDIVDDDYFAWDPAEFASRRDNHMHRAGWQWQIYTALQPSETA